MLQANQTTYTDVEGYDRHLKVFVPFFVTVHNVVYTLLVEVLEKDVSRFLFVVFKNKLYSEEFYDILNSNLHVS